MIFDTHAHYDDEAFNEDREELILSLKENGIGCIVDIGASVSSTKATYALAQKYDFVYAAVGIHPCDTYDLIEDDILSLGEYAKDEKVVAIGEIGLDYHYPDTNKELQKKWFVKQLDLAVETGLPVVIHSRDAAADTMEILKKYEGRISGGVIHCYSYHKEMAEEYVKMGYYIGIGGTLTFKNAKKIKEVAKSIPIDKLVLETDCPYLSPEPNRGKRNDSSNLKYVVKELALIKEMTEEEIEDITFENGKKLYKLDNL